MLRPGRARASRNARSDQTQQRRRRSERTAQASADETIDVPSSDMSDDYDSDLADFIDDGTISEGDQSITILDTPEAPRRRRHRRTNESLTELQRELAELQDSTRSTTPVPPRRRTRLDNAELRESSHSVSPVPPRRRARLDDTVSPISDVRNEPSTSNVHNAPHRIDWDQEDISGPMPPKSNNDQPLENQVLGNNDEDEDTCTICFEDFTTNGEHRLVSLKCGHFFGKTCIERWIRGEKVSQCPQCKTKATLKDVRLHYGRTIKMADNGELEVTRKARDDYKRLCESLEIDVARLQKAIKDMEEKMTQAQYPDLMVKGFKKGTFKICPDARRELSMEGCKAIDFDGTLIFVATKRNGGLFEQYCFTTLNSALKQGSMVPLHSNKIRSISICPSQPNLILSVSEDSTAIIFDLTMQRRSHTFKLGMPGWTGCWLSDTVFAVGLQNGRVLEFDLVQSVHQQPPDLTDGQGNFAILHLSAFDEPQLLLMASLRKVMARHRGQLVTILEHNTDNFHKISCVASDSSSGSFVITIPGIREKNQPTTHRLYKLCEEGALVKCQEIRRITSKSMDLPYILSSSLFNFAGSLVSMAFEPDFNRLAIYDWSDKHKEVYFGMHSTGQVMALRAYPVNEKEMRLWVYKMMLERFVATTSIHSTPMIRALFTITFCLGATYAALTCDKPTGPCELGCDQDSVCFDNVSCCNLSDVHSNGSTIAPTDKPVTEACADKVNPQTGVSDCPKMINYCNVASYHDIMVEQCPKTCGFCGSGTTAGPGTCVDKINPITGVSDCPRMASYCYDPNYVALMRDQCAKTCRFC
ncbi:unnamed protein product, partial [Mesorhabditis belari]|uniref:RING-type E3 ubiquitin transferase n=1 Tax=Mesorhabditis belari TaxID=2138241 RepID=A0AAF3FSK2_9BILA